MRIIKSKTPLLNSYFNLSLLRIFLPGVFLLFYQSLRASTYYFSSSKGSDKYNSIQARNPATPWKTLDKLNSYFKWLGPGDSVLLKRGDIFYGSINAAKSGAVFAPIYIGAYGYGNKPEIDGLTALTSWKLVKQGIYESPCLADGKLLTINGLQQAIGRYPNKGYVAFQSHNDNNSITDKRLTDATNWTGAEVVIRKNRWIIDKSVITGQSNETITYAPGNNAVPINGFGYFIQNSVKTLDQFGEWYFDARKKSMLVFFGAKNPASYTVKTNAIVNLVDISRYNYITFDGLTFAGAGNSAFKITQSSNIIIKNCSIDNCGAIAVLASYSPFLTVTSCIINHSLCGGINLDAGCTRASVVNNYIKNIGLMPGMGGSGSGTYEGITSFGDNAQIEKNRIDSVGYNGIYFGGNSSTVKNNYITYFCLTKDDGAGVYIGDWSKTMNKKVSGNIIVHGVGNSEGTNNLTSLLAEGIYIDDNSESVTISGNSVSQCADNGIKVHNAKDIVIHNNTVYNNGVQLRLEQDHYLATSSYIRNNKITNNTFFSVSNSQAAAKFSTHQDDIAEFGQLDSNFYYLPKNQASYVIASGVKNGKDFHLMYDLSNWRSAYGLDKFSAEYQVAIDNNGQRDYVLFEYNASGKEKIIKLKKDYLDIHNNLYKDIVRIKPYSSIILISSDQQPAKSLQNVTLNTKDFKKHKIGSLLAQN